MSNDRLDERTKRMRQLLTCPKCHRERVLVRNGIVCSMWGCGGIIPLAKKEIADVKKFLREQVKEEKNVAEERSPYLTD